jgi:hypothetical protein
MAATFFASISVPWAISAAYSETSEKAGFQARLKPAQKSAQRTAQESSKKPHDQLRIVIKPNLSAFDENGLTATSPGLVEALIDLLRAAGYRNVDVGTARDLSFLWAESGGRIVLLRVSGMKTARQSSMSATTVGPQCRVAAQRSVPTVTTDVRA